MTAILEAVGLQKRFGAVVAADNIRSSIPRGERVSLIGSNGAGKTSFVNMVTGYLKPDAGRILLDGEDITGTRPARSRTRALHARSRSRNSRFRCRCSTTCWLRPPATGAPFVLRRARCARTHRTCDGSARAIRSVRPAARPVSELPGGQRKLIDIAMALTGTRSCCCSTSRPAAFRSRRSSR